MTKQIKIEKDYVIKTAVTARFYPKQHEVNTNPSLTLPEQTMSIPEIFRRFAAGLPVNGTAPGFYDEDNPMPDLSRMDLTEQDELLQEVKADVALKRIKAKELTDFENQEKAKLQEEERLKQLELDLKAIPAPSSTNNP